MFASTINVTAVVTSTKVNVWIVFKMQIPNLLVFVMTDSTTVTQNTLVSHVAITVSTALVTLSMSVILVEADFITGTNHTSVSRSAQHTSCSKILF